MYKRATSGKRKRIISIGCLSMLLAACGGGGGGDSQVTVTATAGSGGSITPVSQSVAKGSTVTFTVQPDANYTVQSVTGCAGSLQGSTYRTGSVNSNCSVQASFVIRPFEATISGLSDSLAEGSSGEFVINTNYATGTVTSNLTVSLGDSALTLTKLSETTYRYTASEIDRDVNVTINWTAQDGSDTTRQLSGSVNLTIANSSFTNQLATIQTFKDNDERLLGLDEEKRLVAALHDVALVLGSDTSLSTQSAHNTELEEAFVSAFQTLSAHLENYLLGQSSDAELQAQFDDALSRFSSFAASYKQDINAYLAVLSAEGMAPVIASDFHINPELGSVSLFVGNTALGAINDSAWIFNNDVAYLGGLLANTGCEL